MRARIDDRLRRAEAALWTAGWRRAVRAWSSPPPAGYRPHPGDQPVVFAGLGQVALHASVRFGWHQAPGYHGGYVLLDPRTESSRIVIGPGAVVGNRNALVAERSTIEIGAACLLGPDVLIVDSDFHDLEPGQRHSGRHVTASVTLGADVFVGARATILKGVTIGDGAVIGAGATVACDVPAGGVLVAGPSRLVR